jgi:twitching motility two-component system response regulator PilH
VEILHEKYFSQQATISLMRSRSAMLELDVRIAIARSEEVTVNAAADDGECPVDPKSVNDDVRRVPRDTRRILVVDDTADTREMFALYFRSRGFTVVTASSGRAAIDAARRLHPDVIVMDVAMPDLDGISATREIRKDPQTVDIPVVIVTAYPIRAIKGGALETGTRFVMKPCTPEELEEQVCSVLAARHSGDEPGS